MKVHNCIYTSLCDKQNCDRSCARNAEISYWMERCNIEMNNPILKNTSEFTVYRNIIDNSIGKIKIVNAKDTVKSGDFLCYVAISLHGTGLAFSKGIYKLNFSEYIEKLKDSWNSRYESESLEYMRIWLKSERYVIINGMDYVRFGDFESQTLLQIMQSRRSVDQSTILVIPGIDQLVGVPTSVFFTRLIDKLNEVKDQ